MRWIVSQSTPRAFPSARVPPKKSRRESSCLEVSASSQSLMPSTKMASVLKAIAHGTRMPQQGIVATGDDFGFMCSHVSQSAAD